MNHEIKIPLDVWLSLNKAVAIAHTAIHHSEPNLAKQHPLWVEEIDKASEYLVKAFYFEESK